VILKAAVSGLQNNRLLHSANTVANNIVSTFRNFALIKFTHY